MDILDNDNLVKVLETIAYLINETIQEGKLEEFIKKSELTTRNFDSHFQINFINTKIKNNFIFETTAIAEYKATNGYSSYIILDEENKILIVYKSKSSVESSSLVKFLNENNNSVLNNQMSFLDENLNNVKNKIDSVGLDNKYNAYMFVTVVYESNFKLGQIKAQVRDSKNKLIAEKILSLNNNVTVAKKYVEDNNRKLFSPITEEKID